MKNLKSILVSAVVLGLANTALAGEVQKVESYAHPTMFGSQAQETAEAQNTYIVGAKIKKQKKYIAVNNKDSVMINSWAQDVLTLIKNHSGKSFNAKMPVLRSELAVILSEGFSLNDTSAKKQYKDIKADYWAKDWIYRSTNAGVMIGYPDNTFKADQPVTKAEVFATIAQLIDVPIDRSLIVPQFEGRDVQYIPRWAITPTKEVLRSELLKDVPNPQKVADDEYLSKEQVAYLISSLRYNWSGKNTLKKDKNAPDAIKGYTPTVLNIKLIDRLSARTSNIGDTFKAKTTKDVTINGKCFKSGSDVYGQVVAVNRPGVKNPGYIKVKFVKIKDGNNCEKFPKNLSEATAENLRNPNILARLVASPFSTAARIVGVTGRTIGGSVNVAGNGLEEFGDHLSNGAADIFTLHPGEGAKHVGYSVFTLGKGVYNICELLASGVFGVIYEVTDELRYVIVPKYSNASSLNPGEELNVIF